jgi:hypothetical protein
VRSKPAQPARAARATAVAGSPPALSDPDVPKGMSIELLKDLHLLTRDGQLNADARRKLKQIRHFMGLLAPALEDALARHPSPRIVDCAAGKSYLGFLLYELVLGPAGRGELLCVEARPALTAGGADRAARFAHERLRFVTGRISEVMTPEPHPSFLEGGVQVVTALHACDTATDDALAFGIERGAEHIAVVPCCQAEVARQLADVGPRDELDGALIDHPLHRRELGSHLTNVIRALCLEAHGYRTTVTELVGWEHSLKNELILGRRIQRTNPVARRKLEALLARWRVSPTLVQRLGLGLGEAAPPPSV